MVDTAKTRFEALKKLKTLNEFIPHRVKVAPHTEALRQYDRRTNSWERISYQDLNERILLWRYAFANMNLAKGSRIAILLPNGVDAVCCDQAAMANGLVPVPLHAIDTAGSSAFIIADSQAKVLVTNHQNRWHGINLSGVEMPELSDVIFTDDVIPEKLHDTIRYWELEEWLATGHSTDESELDIQVHEDDLATIVYTSGTTGRPKGVMLTHKNIVSNVIDTLETVVPQPGDVFLSFLPLSHTFERMAGYHLALGMGCTIVYNRSILQLAEDFRTVKPNVIISVPRIYERIYAKVQERLLRGPAMTRWLFNWAVNVGWRRFCKKNGLKLEKGVCEFLDPLVWPILKATVADTLLKQFGGQLKIAISGGAALNGKVAKAFCGLGLPIIQGYGMTESSPIIAGNSLSYNRPHTVGKPLPNTQVRLDEETGEIQVKSDSVMLGYWNRPEDTQSVFTEDGWLKTGDVGLFEDHQFLRIVGRIKEIIVTSTGEKIPPADMELAIEIDPLFEQAYIIGDNRPFISTIVVLNKEEWKRFAQTMNVDPNDPESLLDNSVKKAVLKRIRALIKTFPQYAIPRNVTLTLEPWTIENGLLTPTLKLKRRNLMNKFAAQIQAMYAGHR